MPYTRVSFIVDSDVQLCIGSLIYCVYVAIGTLVVQYQNLRKVTVGRIMRHTHTLLLIGPQWDQKVTVISLGMYVYCYICSCVRVWFFTNLTG